MAKCVEYQQILFKTATKKMGWGPPGGRGPKCGSPALLNNYSLTQRLDNSQASHLYVAAPDRAEILRVC